MADSPSQKLGPAAQASGPSGAWPVVIVVLGASLWVQIFGVSTADELSFQAPRIMTMAAYLAPLAVVVVAGWRRWAPASLMVFPVCFIPGIWMMADQSRSMLEAPASLLRIGVTLAAYVAAAALGTGPPRGRGQAQVEDGRTARHFEGIYPFYFVIRGAILVVILLVVQYAVFGAPAVAADMARRYPRDPAGARTFIGLVSFFGWCVAAYTMFFVPWMNLEYDVRTLARATSSGNDGVGQAARLKRIGAWLLAAAVALGLVWFAR